MKKDRKSEQQMREEYDFSGAQRGKYAPRFADGSNIVMLDPEVSEVFPDSESVNKVLRAITAVVRGCQEVDTGDKQ